MKVIGFSLNDGASKWENHLQGLVIPVPWHSPMIDDGSIFSGCCLGRAGITLELLEYLEAHIFKGKEILAFEEK